MSSKHYILRVGDCSNFINSSKQNMWGINSRNKTFKKKVKKDDVLWFIRTKNKDDIHRGRIIAVAEYFSNTERVLGPLISTTLDNNQLGWDNKGNECDIEIYR